MYSPEEIQIHSRNNILTESLELVKEAARVIAFAGELREKKGMRPFLGAYAQVNKKGPATLLVVGNVRAGEDKQMFVEFKLSNPNAGKLVCANENNGLAEVIRELLDNESSRKNLGSAARQRIIDKCTPQAELEGNATLHHRPGRKTWHSHSKLILYYSNEVYYSSITGDK